MAHERRQVLDMLAAGKISTEDAERLLDKLGGDENIAPIQGRGTTAMPQWMCVNVATQEGDAVNVRLPLALLKSGIKLSALMPREAAEAMKKNGLDFGELSGLAGDDLINAIKAMQIDVATHEGDVVKVCCE